MNSQTWAPLWPLGCPVGAGDEACNAADAHADGLADPLDVGIL